jgi:SAM-dependent methyltransferase
MAQPTVRDRILVGNIEQTLRQPDLGTFDVVTAFDIIEHVADPASLLAQIRKVLKPGGVLVLTTPDTSHWLRYAMGASWPMLQPSQHLVLFSRRAMTGLLRASGFDPVRTRDARKVFTLRYLFGQLRILAPAIWKTYTLLARLVPGRLLAAEFTVNIGEFIVVARSKGP